MKNAKESQHIHQYSNYSLGFSNYLYSGGVNHDCLAPSSKQCQIIGKLENAKGNTKKNGKTKGILTYSLIFQLLLRFFQLFVFWRSEPGLSPPPIVQKNWKIVKRKGKLKIIEQNGKRKGIVTYSSIFQLFLRFFQLFALRRRKSGQ